jgi:hypothetical protein
MLLGKRLELLHELVPKAFIIGILVKPDSADAEPEIGEMMAAAVINLKTAKALGLIVPLPLLGLADEVIKQASFCCRAFGR